MCMYCEPCINRSIEIRDQYSRNMIILQYSDQAIKNSLGSSLNMTLSIVKRSNDSITNIISGFDKVHDLLSEIGYASYLKQGDTENARRQLEIEKIEEEERKKEYAERVREKEKFIEAKNNEVEQLKIAYKTRAEEFQRAQAANSKIKKGKYYVYSKEQSIISLMLVVSK